MRHVGIVADNLDRRGNPGDSQASCCSPAGTATAESTPPERPAPPAGSSRPQSAPAIRNSIAIGRGPFSLASGHRDSQKSGARQWQGRRTMAKLAFLGPRRDGLPDGGPPASGRSRRHASITAARPRPKNGSQNMAGAPPPPRAKPPLVPILSWPVSATTMICARSALGDDGAFAGMAEGAIFVDHTTVSAKVTRELYAAAKAAGLSFVDAPISGGQAGRKTASLSIMCGGDSDAYDARRANHGHLCQGLPPNWRKRRGPADQDVPTRSPLPVWFRACPRRCISPRRPASTGARWSR